MEIFFYITAAVAIVSAAAATTRRDAMHGILYLILMLLALAILFFILGAPFVAALQVIVYAGAIVVLFLFVIMMVNPPPSSHGGRLKGWLAPLILAGILGVQWYFLLQEAYRPLAVSSVGPEMIGTTFFADYAYALPLVGVFLLVGMIGAFHLGRPAEKPEVKE